MTRIDDADKNGSDLRRSAFENPLYQRSKYYNMKEIITRSHISISMHKKSTIIYLFLILLFSSCSQDRSEEFQVMSGPFRQSVIETGELDAVHAAVITTPSMNYQYGFSFKIIGLVEHGRTVQKGDSVIALDPANLNKTLITLEETLENERATANRQSVQRENNIQTVRAQLKNEQAAYDIKKLALERSKFDSGYKKKIIEFEFKQAEIRLNKVKRNLELKPVLEDLDLKIQKIKVRQREIEIAGAKEALKRLVIYSPGDGIFQVAKQYYSPSYVRLGDNVYRGSKIASIPDLRKMKAISYVGETDIRKVQTGMKVIVRLDALPSVPFHGTVTFISKICTELNDKKVFATEIEIGESDLRLKPGMTVSCEYICYDTETALYVPNSCLIKMKGHSYIFLDRGGAPRKLEVETGPSNSHHTVIYTEIKPGQKLVSTEKIDINKFL